ncbi:MAG TPA: thiol:disulfide interchange protein DsbA/DsbL [Telluria sp.]|nr:thiol:disulfide interchange protein DsbA/DsbL [Telluria sp.]
MALSAAASPGDPRMGTEYQLLAAPQPVEAAGAKVEVIEFFMYHCPYCNALEPELAAWVKRQGERIAFRRVHIPYSGANDPEAHLFLTLDAMGKLDAMHAKVLHAVHGERQRLMKDDAIVDWVGRNGIDKAEFLAVWNSFGVTTRLKRLPRTIGDYGVDSAPMIVVNGRYRTSPAMAGAGAPAGGDAMAQTVQVLDVLVAKAAKENQAKAAATAQQ